MPVLCLFWVLPAVAKPRICATLLCAVFLCVRLGCISTFWLCAQRHRSRWLPCDVLVWRRRCCKGGDTGAPPAESEISKRPQSRPNGQPQLLPIACCRRQLTKLGGNVTSPVIRSCVCAFWPASDWMRRANQNTSIARDKRQFLFPRVWPKACLPTTRFCPPPVRFSTANATERRRFDTCDNGHLGRFLRDC